MNGRRVERLGLLGHHSSFDGRHHFALAFRQCRLAVPFFGVLAEEVVVFRCF